ncbi:heavy-metal-associated domain-containing protein [Oxynema aestuarii]|jgi:copper chaperone|uniref:Heavy-metal-associated domain-containing protein n=1 Tax=Oxynema aestuarii AP17 TaxID=2064643 RepID=A0A6H1U0M6_9CYAN|nr:heavy-metal-associated domain-containing protein [Oxynema aestuarii]QIZ71169.1 heavy-metal-associated domain-containing protein [Oxynema aestuarii AP17]RMH76962.1 MAG: copper chaperone [Cyanobacteria bacterium J007]
MTINLKVPSMVCDGCAETVTKAVKTVDGQARVNIDLDSKLVAIESAASPESFEQAITAVGHDVDEA